MKIIIIEGADNLGKSTVIHKLMEQYNSVLYVHCQKPKSDDPIYAAIEQRDTFMRLVEQYIIKPHENNSCADVCIFDRSWVGEYVYGTLYRGNSKKYVMDMIDSINQKLNEFTSNWNSSCMFSEECRIYYILLEPCSSEFCLNNDDGLSLSNKNLEMIENELDLFSEIFTSINIDINEYPYIYTKRILVENQEQPGSFNTIKDIMENVNFFVNEEYKNI